MIHESDRTHQQLLHALHGIVVGRWFLFAGLGLFGLMQQLTHFTLLYLPLPVIGTLLAVAFLYNAVNTYYVQHAHAYSYSSLRLFAAIQVIADQCLFTLVIYLSGGVESVAYILYVFPMLTATILYADFQIIAFGFLSVVLYTAMVIAEFLGLFPHMVVYSSDIFGNVNETINNTLIINFILMFMYMFAVFVNRIIHDREQQIVIERDTVRSILYSLEEGIVMLDPQKRVLLMNPPARDLLRLYSTTSRELRKEDVPELFWPLIAELRLQPSAKQLGKEVVIRDARHTMHIQLDSIPIHSSRGVIMSWVKVLRDVTREKELDEIKSDFISVAAHQLRTPLAALKWFFKIMSEGDIGPVNKRQEELLSKAYERNNEVIDIVNDLLDISEIEEGRFPYEFSEGNPLQVVRQVVERVQLDADRKQQEIRMNMQEDMPPIEMDKQKLHMALLNIIDNALKYSPVGSVVHVDVLLKNNHCFIRVQDSGIGIPKDQQSKLFSKFFRGRNAKEYVTTGSGLGLYIVHNVVTSHRGRIWFESEEGEGTTFYLTLPVHPKHLNTPKEGS